MNRHRKRMIKADGRKNSVQAFMKRVVLILTSLVAMSSVVVLLLVYLPLKKELEKSLIDNFHQLSLIRYNSLNSNMNRALEGARSLASRSVIRDAILLYETRIFDLETLIKATQPRYEEGARALESLIKAERFVDNIKISEYETEQYKEHSCQTDERLTRGNETSFALCLTDDHSYFVVISPILLERRVIGFDRLVFDLSEQVRMLSSDEIHSELMYDDGSEPFYKGKQLVKSGEGFVLLREGNRYFLSFDMQDDIYHTKGKTYFISTQSADSLFDPVHRLSKLTLHVAIGVLLAFSAAIYVFIIRFATNELVYLEDSRRSLTRAVTEANIDPLTGVSGRRFGENFLKDIFEDFQEGAVSPAIVLFDIDSLKLINDTHGHAAGDQVIHAIAKAVQCNIRRGDLLIRWGGDEFIGVFQDLKAENTMPFAQKLLKAVSGLQVQTAAGDIQPTISIGISYFRAEDKDVFDVIERADRAMYQSKAEGKNRAHRV